MILTLRTDKPEAEVGLYKDNEQAAYFTWLAHRELAETLHLKIKELLDREGKDMTSLQGIVAYKGPGSFTGLRIGLSVANALAYSLDIPIVGIEGEDGWIDRGLNRLRSFENDRTIIPEYGAPVHITRPRA